MFAILRSLFYTSLCITLVGGSALAQTSRGQHHQGNPGPGHPPPRPPIDSALDVNDDRTIDAGEIKNAAAALIDLDSDGDGRLDVEECLPKPPEGARPKVRPGGAVEGNAQRPKPPMFTALDVDGNGVLSATEIAGAATALLTLDTDGDGQLSPDERRPIRPGNQSRRR